MAFPSKTAGFSTPAGNKSPSCCFSGKQRRGRATPASRVTEQVACLLEGCCLAPPPLSFSLHRSWRSSGDDPGHRRCHVSLLIQLLLRPSPPPPRSPLASLRRRNQQQLLPWLHALLAVVGNLSAGLLLLVSALVNDVPVHP